jgi:hypothetical protein
VEQKDKEIDELRQGGASARHATARFSRQAFEQEMKTSRITLTQEPRHALATTLPAAPARNMASTTAAPPLTEKLLNALGVVVHDLHPHEYSKYHDEDMHERHHRAAAAPTAQRQQPSKHDTLSTPAHENRIAAVDVTPTLIPVFDESQQQQQQQDTLSTQGSSNNSTLPCNNSGVVAADTTSTHAAALPTTATKDIDQHNTSNNACNKQQHNLADVKPHTNPVQPSLTHMRVSATHAYIYIDAFTHICLCIYILMIISKI